jgi:hypothetical protein
MRRWMLVWLLFGGAIAGGLSLAGGNPGPFVLYGVLAAGGLGVEFTRKHRERVWRSASVNRVLFNAAMLTGVVVVADLVLAGLAIAAPRGEREPFVVLAVILAPMSVMMLYVVVVGGRRFKAAERSSDSTDGPRARLRHVGRMNNDRFMLIFYAVSAVIIVTVVMILVP